MLTQGMKGTATVSLEEAWFLLERSPKAGLSSVWQTYVVFGLMV
jgi:hypothetical protein